MDGVSFFFGTTAFGDRFPGSMRGEPRANRASIDRVTHRLGGRGCVRITRCLVGVGRSPKTSPQTMSIGVRKINHYQHAKGRHNQRRSQRHRLRLEPISSALQRGEGVDVRHQPPRPPSGPLLFHQPAPLIFSRRAHATDPPSPPPPSTPAQLLTALKLPTTTPRCSISSRAAGSRKVCSSTSR